MKCLKNINYKKSKTLHFTYYTPAINQFVDGFEFEFYATSKTWLPLTFKPGMFNIPELLTLIIPGREGVRAKHYKPFMQQFTTSDGVKYTTDQFGVIHQLEPKPFIYDENYVSTYDTEAYRQGEQVLQALRYGFVCACHGRPPKTLLDYGCGNGAFVDFANKNSATKAYGYDISGKAGVLTELAPAEVYTFWDSLEHLPDTSFIAKIRAETIIVSLPWLHSSINFDSWKHRKPDEHLHHFNDISLRHFMARNGWESIAVSNHEDIIRTPVNGLANILTMGFRR